jgi:Carboxypeptidase regulatory-like domain
MRKLQALRGPSALVLAASILSAAPLNAAQQPAPALLRGNVLAVSGSATGTSHPVSGAVVKALEIESGRTYESVVSNADGAYSLPGLESGNYALAVRANGAVFLSDTIVGVKSGETRTVSFSLQKAEEPPAPPPAPPEGGTPADTADEKKPDSSKPKGSGFWAEHPWLAGLAVGGSAIVIGVLADQLTDEETQQESNPSPSSSR